MQEHFGELRSLVEQTPSTSAFEHIAYFIEHHDSPSQREEIRAKWLPYLLGKLASWPDATRLCPKPLLERYESAEATWHPLVRALDFEKESLAKRRTERLLAATHMQDITSVDLRSVRIKWPQLSALATQAPFGSVDHVAFRKGTKSSDLDALATFFGSKMLQDTTSLSLAGWSNVDAGVYDTLLEHFPVENLRKLDLSGTRIISSKRFKSLLDTGRFSHLEEIKFQRQDGGGSKGLIRPISLAPDLTRLKKIRGAWANSKDLRAFASAEHFTQLEELHLLDVECRLTDLEAMLEAGNLPALKHLSLGLTGKRPAPDTRGGMMRALGESELLRQLDTLTISSSNGHLDLCAFLDAADHDLDHLTHFAWWTWANGTLDGIAATARPELESLARTSFQRLRGIMLHLYSMHEDPDDHDLLSALAKAPWLSQLRELQLHSQVFHCDDLMRLLTSSDVPALHALGFDASLSLDQWHTLFEEVDLSCLEALRVWCHHRAPRELLKALPLLHTYHDCVPRLRRVLTTSAFDYFMKQNPMREAAYAHANQWITLDTEYIIGDGFPIWLSR